MAPEQERGDASTPTATARARDVLLDARDALLSLACA